VCFRATWPITADPTLQSAGITLPKCYYHCDPLSGPRHRLLNLPETRSATQRWQSIGLSVGSALIGQAGAKNALYNNHLSLISSWTSSTICSSCTSPCTWRNACAHSLTCHCQLINGVSLSTVRLYRSTDLPVLPLRHLSSVSCLFPLIPSQLNPLHQSFISFVLFASFDVPLSYQYFVLCHEIIAFC